MATSIGVSQPKRTKTAGAAAIPPQGPDAPKTQNLKRPINAPNADPTQLSPEFGKQMKQAGIPRLRRRLIQLPREHSSYNDDVEMDAFCPFDMTYSGKQRRGIREHFGPCNSMQDHAHRALKGRFSRAAPIPMPEHIKMASVLTRDCPPGELVKFWDAQLSRLEQLVDDCKMAQKKRSDRILPEIAPSDGMLNTVATSLPMHHFGIEGQRRIRQFALGFPIAGTLSQLKAFSPG